MDLDLRDKLKEKATERQLLLVGAVVDDSVLYSDRIGSCHPLGNPLVFACFELITHKISYFRPRSQRESM